VAAISQNLREPGIPSPSTDTVQTPELLRELFEERDRKTIGYPEAVVDYCDESGQETCVSQFTGLGWVETVQVSAEGTSIMPVVHRNARARADGTVEPAGLSPGWVTLEYPAPQAVRGKLLVRGGDGPQIP
jgi:hypothetical protein